MTPEEIEVMAAAHFADGNAKVRWKQIAPDMQGRLIRRMRLACEALERHRAALDLEARRARRLAQESSTPTSEDRCMTP